MSTLFRFWQVLKEVPQFYFEEKKNQKEIEKKGLIKYIEDEERQITEKKLAHAK